MVNEASLDNGAFIIQLSTGIGNDEWKLIFTGLNECKIKNLHSGKLLVVKNASIGTGLEIIQYDEKGTDNEFWILEYPVVAVSYTHLRAHET